MLGGFEAGSKIKGNAMLLVKKSFKVDGFHLAVEGRENTTVHYTTTETYTSNGQTHTRTHHHYAYVVICAYHVMDHFFITFIT